MRKLILRNGLSPGDIVMLTAAVRDLHICYPNEFITDVRTSCGELWEHNPYITSISETTPGVENLECSYPLINYCNELPYHAVHGFIHCLNGKLDLSIEPTAFRGDIHLSREEKNWHSQVHELTRRDTPFWIVSAGGKYDVTIKWWDHKKYQAVVDHFRGKIQFVQIGSYGHYHPRLDGVIDLRGQTNLRELVRLVYHSQGVLCGVTALMHLAAAIETKPPTPAHRPAVIIAGAREPSQWEQYPYHQFISNNGSLPCSEHGGCWKDRIRRLGDGDDRDDDENLCSNLKKGLPLCMEMIRPEEVIHQIESYYEGGALNYLRSRQVKAAQKGIDSSRKNPFDDQALTLGNARLACEAFLRKKPAYPGRFQGKGIVICGGGLKYFVNAWVCIKLLRAHGCTLPIELWHLGGDELDAQMAALVKELGVQCVDALEVRKKFPVRHLGGWELKAYSLLHSSFEEVLFLDADNAAIRDPDFLFNSPEYQEHGAIFWPDYGRFEKAAIIWKSCGLDRPNTPEFESGQMVVDKRRCWRALTLALWFNENSDFYYQYLHGDKETFHLAFCLVRKSFALVPHSIHTLPDAAMCQHDFQGRRLFQHRNSDKWNFSLRNKHVPDFWLEEDCRNFVLELQQQWDGGVKRAIEKSGGGRRAKKLSTPPRIHACLISCFQREQIRSETLSSLKKTDWGDRPVHVYLDEFEGSCPKERQTSNALRALAGSLQSPYDYLLFLEDDLHFNENILHNILLWEPVRTARLTLGGLYNPGLRESACDPRKGSLIVAAQDVFGSQAFLIARSAVEFLVKNWNRQTGMQDIRMSRLAGEMGQPLWYHSPSLVQHVGKTSLWGGFFHEAVDFDAAWKAASQPAVLCST